MLAIGKLCYPPKQTYSFPFQRAQFILVIPIPVPQLYVRSLEERQLIILKFKYLQTKRSLIWTNIYHSAILGCELDGVEVVSLGVELIVPCREESKEQVKFLMSRMVDSARDSQCSLNSPFFPLHFPIYFLLGWDAESLPEKWTTSRCDGCHFREMAIVSWYYASPSIFSSLDVRAWRQVFQMTGESKTALTCPCMTSCE